MNAVEKAAYEWWKMHRPGTYSEKEHLADPTVNTGCSHEKTQLALAVAQMVRTRKVLRADRDAKAAKRLAKQKRRK